MTDEECRIEQLQLDLEDANKRLERLRAAIIARDEADARVVHLAAELRRSRRLAKEARWNVDGMLSAEKRKGPPAVADAGAAKPGNNGQQKAK